MPARQRGESVLLGMRVADATCLAEQGPFEASPVTLFFEPTAAHGIRIEHSVRHYEERRFRTDAGTLGSEARECPQCMNVDDIAILNLALNRLPQSWTETVTV